MRSGETDIAETVDPETFEDAAMLIAAHLHHVANLDVDCLKQMMVRLLS